MTDLELRENLTNEIVKEFDHLNSVEPGSEEHKAIVENICKMYKVQMDETVNEENLRMAEAKEEEERKNRKLDRILKYAFEGSCFGLMFLFNWIWTKRGLEFEETGTFSSGITRNIFRNFGRMKN